MKWWKYRWLSKWTSGRLYTFDMEQTCFFASHLQWALYQYCNPVVHMNSVYIYVYRIQYKVLARLYTFDMEQTCFFCITAFFNRLSANAVVYEFCILTFVNWVQYKVYCTCTSLYFWHFDREQTCFLHHSFPFFNRLSRALCQCSGLKYHVFLCICICTSMYCSQYFSTARPPTPGYWHRVAVSERQINESDEWRKIDKPKNICLMILYLIHILTE